MSNASGGYTVVFGATPAGGVASKGAELAKAATGGSHSLDLKTLGMEIAVAAIGAVMGMKFLKKVYKVGGTKGKIMSAVTGAAVADAGHSYYKGDKPRAYTQLAGAVGAVAGAHFVRKHPVVGFLGGSVAAAAVTGKMTGYTPHLGK